MRYANTHRAFYRKSSANHNNNCFANSQFTDIVQTVQCRYFSVWQNFLWVSGKSVPILDMVVFLKKRMVFLENV